MKKNIVLYTVFLMFTVFSSSLIAQEKQVEVRQLTLDELLNDADAYVDQMVKVTGNVTHTCKHSGRRCFLSDKNKKHSVRVEAKGDIKSFNRELTGSEIEVEGILHEKRLTSEQIDAMEKKIEEKRINDDGSVESCDAEKANVTKMREWMKEKGKSYYSIYYIDGDSFSEVK